MLKIKKEKEINNIFIQRNVSLKTENSYFSKPQSMSSNAFFSFLVKFLTAFIPLILTPYLSRVLLPEQIGMFSYTFSIVSYFTLVISFGFSGYGTRLISINRKDVNKMDKYITEIIALRSILFVIVGAIYVILIYTNFLGSNIDYKIIYTIFTFYLINNVIDITFVYQGIEKFKLISLRISLFKIIKTILILVFIRSEKDFYLYVLIETLCTTMEFLFSYLLLKKHFLFVKFKLSDLFIHLKKSFVYFIPTVAISIYFNVDKTMIGIFSGELEVAYYEQMNKFNTMLKTIVGSIYPILLSRVSILFAEKKFDKIRQLVTRSIKVVYLILIPATIGLMFLGPNAIKIFFGNQYLPALDTYYVLALLSLVPVMSTILAQAYFSPIGKQIYSTVFCCIGAVLNVILNAILIPLYADFGAAIATIITEFIISILAVFFSRKFFNYKEIICSFDKIFVSSLIMLLSLFLSQVLLQNKINDLVLIFTQIIIGMFAYFITLRITKDESFMSLLNIFANKINKVKKTQKH